MALSSVDQYMKPSATLVVFETKDIVANSGCHFISGKDWSFEAGADGCELVDWDDKTYFL